MFLKKFREKILYKKMPQAYRNRSEEEIERDFEKAMEELEKVTSEPGDDLEVLLPILDKYEEALRAKHILEEKKTYERHK